MTAVIGPDTLEVKKTFTRDNLSFSEGLPDKIEVGFFGVERGVKGGLNLTI